jgi:glutamate/tyrosine decarboxylase-like PLP-dependent enzyme
MEIDALEASIREDRKRGHHPFAVIGTAGTVNSGAFDDLNGIADLCDKEGLWFHVDGAFGSWVKISETHNHLADGLERADSLAVDLHKWMSMPYGIGCTLVKDRAAHYSTFVYGHEAEYLKTAKATHGDALTNPLNLSLALSRPDYGLKAYMLLRAYGREKYSKLVQQNIDQMSYLADLIRKEPNMEVAAPVGSNIVCFRYLHEGLSEALSEKLNRMILSELWKINISMINDTKIKGRHVLRACNVNHRSKYSDFDLLVERITSIGDKLAKQIA